MKWARVLGSLKWAEAFGAAIASPTTRRGNRIEFLIETLPVKVKRGGVMARIILSRRRQWFKSDFAAPPQGSVASSPMEPSGPAADI